MWNSSRCLTVLLCAFIGAAACGNKTPSQPTPQPCAYTLSKSSLSFAAGGGTDSVAVTTAAACTWSAASDRGWMAITSGANGTGSGTVNVTLTANTTTAERTGTLTIASQNVAVRQDAAAAPCNYELSPTTASFGKDAATGTFTVSAGSQCTWSAASSAGWLAVTSGSAGTGNGTVGYSIERNRETVSRTAAIAVANRTFTVTQAGDTPAPVCEYSVTPVEFTPCMTSPPMTATITTLPACTWTVEPDASWITVTSAQSGSGPGTITFRVSDNWDAPRHSVVKVRWPTVTAGQNLQIQQAGCTYAVSVSTFNIVAAGGTGRFDVIQQSIPYTCGGPTQNACIWIAQSDVPWITVTTSMPQAGDNPVSFSVTANDGAARTGRITVRDKVVVITQAGK